VIRELVELFRGKERVSLYIEGGGGGWVWGTRADRKWKDKGEILKRKTSWLSVVCEPRESIK
jgi:hypothetical protein